MKHNHNHDNAPNLEPQLVPVTFEYDDPTAIKVCVAGCFNHWNSTNRPMHLTAVGHWRKETALAPGSYEYCIVVDGRWVPDPAARESVPNPFGGRNSILEVALSPGAAQLAKAESQILKNANDE